MYGCTVRTTDTTAAQRRNTKLPAEAAESASWQLTASDHLALLVVGDSCYWCVKSRAFASTSAHFLACLLCKNYRQLSSLPDMTSTHTGIVETHGTKVLTISSTDDSRSVNKCFLLILVITAAALSPAALPMDELSFACSKLLYATARLHRI